MTEDKLTITHHGNWVTVKSPTGELLACFARDRWSQLCKQVREDDPREPKAFRVGDWIEGKDDYQNPAIQVGTVAKSGKPGHFLLKTNPGMWLSLSPDSSPLKQAAGRLSFRREIVYVPRTRDAAVAGTISTEPPKVGDVVSPQNHMQVPIGSALLTLNGNEPLLKGRGGDYLTHKVGLSIQGIVLPLSRLIYIPSTPWSDRDDENLQYIGQGPNYLKYNKVPVGTVAAHRAHVGRAVLKRDDGKWTSIHNSHYMPSDSRVVIHLPE